MNILITGVNGFVGKELYKELKTHYTIFGITSSKTNYNNFLQLDLTSKENTESFIKKNEKLKIDTIIHLASKLSFNTNIDEFSVVYDNLLITQNITSLAIFFKPKIFINLSSSSVYPNIDGTFSENDIIDPSKNTDCLYGLSKFNSEIIFNYKLKNIVKNIVNLRVSMIVGEDMNSTRIIPILKKEIHEYKKVTLFGNGNRLLNFIHVDKLINYIKYFINNPTNDTFNISDKCISLKDLASQLITESNASDIKIQLIDKGNTNQFIIDFAKLKKYINA